MQNEVLGISIGLAIKGIGEISKVNSPFANLKAKLEFTKGTWRFFARGWGYSLTHIALIGHTMGFGYNEILDMEVEDFAEFVQIAKEIAKNY
ncbi:hypothetical protein [Campylobacter vicugnae]|uniref:hypothetical protein n=1 Tax=Campylobacter vicugnae TaxID=1660076 RepID=UPI000A355B81|nr:hypothetical protein [Campylobacter sp. RM8965]